MAEFRKREDITQEIDILQTWTEMGAPKMGDLEPNLASLVKSVDLDVTRAAEGQPVPRPTTPPTPPRPVAPPVVVPVEEVGGGEPPAPPEPPSPYADLPPGDDEERPARGGLVPLIAALLLVGAGAAFLFSRWEPITTANRPVPSPGEAGQEGATPTRAPATLGPEAAPSTAARPSAVAAEAPASKPPAAAGQARPSAHPGVIAAVTQPPRAVVRTYRVKAGDSLSAIARDHLGNLERWHELYAANQDQVADPNLIQPGETLVLPETPTYTVKPGDTLKAIAAAKLGSADRWREIYDLNRKVLPSPGVVPPGIQLALPAGSAGAGPTGAKPGLGVKAVQAYHTVKPGDSLSLLARRYLGSERRWTEIYYANSHKIANPNWLFPGQVLAIPSARQRAPFRYVVRAGDCLWAIAGRELGQPLRWTQIYAANKGQIRNPHWIYPGQILQLP